jgi:hypothetical protein
MQTVKIEQNDSQCVVTWWYFSPVVSLQITMLAGLSVGGTSLTHLAVVQREFVVFLLALPFWVFLLLLFALTVHMLFGKTKFILDEHGLKTTYTCLAIKREKRFDLAGICCFEKAIRNRPAKYNSGESHHFLRVVHQSGNVDFWLPTKKLEEELGDLCEQLNDFLAEMKAGNVA